jgi:carbamoyltransferase
MLHVLRGARERYGIDRLCIAGGVALNCLANGRVARESGFDAIFVPPAPDDSGAVLGAAQAVAHMTLGIPRNGGLERADLGPEYTQARIRAALSATPYGVSQPHDLADAAAQLIDAGQIVGWFQGRMEFGPRALGYRSILADPRRPDLQEKLNALKHRESFRPFAPAVLAEHCDELFDGASPSPFMSIAARARAGACERIPAAVHVDGTARIQTLGTNDGGPLRAVVEAFYRRTGVPCVINTSLNCATPIAATPEDALACFERAQLDALFIGPYLVTRRLA